MWSLFQVVPKKYILCFCMFFPILPQCSPFHIPKSPRFFHFSCQVVLFVSRCSFLGVVFQQLVHSKLCLVKPRNGETGIPGCRFGKLGGGQRRYLDTGGIILPTQTMHYLREIPQNYHTFALFDSPQMGNLMIPEISRYDICVLLEREICCIPKPSLTSMFQKFLLIIVQVCKCISPIWESYKLYKVVLLLDAPPKCHIEAGNGNMAPFSDSHLSFFQKCRWGVPKIFTVP